MTVWHFVSDVDDTLLGDDVASDRLITIYNSSRPCASLRQTPATVPDLPLPNYLAGAMGTEIQEGIR